MTRDPDDNVISLHAVRTLRAEDPADEWRKIREHMDLTYKQFPHRNEFDRICAAVATGLAHLNAS